ncbi:pilus assembly protein TadG-related protein [Streptomyces sp. NPDC007991]|uniref:pilus assembly protein TadG-related protein n=1 Tax=Streptomyces sp. NPDC007991 TaxID=3364803 RepID=UPI0036E461CD
MRQPRRYGDAGQAFPIYITVVGGLLFLAFAYFAVGQAAANRNGAQTAADAAALAAAQDRRDQLAGAWVKDVLDPTKWQGIFEGNAEGLQPSCWRAYELAAQNDAQVLSCGPEGLLGFTVKVETNKSVGDSVVPGTAERKSDATATAVIEPLCDFDPPAEDDGAKVLPQLSCEDGEDWKLDPEDLDVLPEPEDLFDVHLADPQANDE